MKNVDTSLGEAPSIAERLRWGGSHGTALYFLLTVSTFPRHRCGGRCSSCRGQRMPLSLRDCRSAHHQNILSCAGMLSCTFPEIQHCSLHKPSKENPIVTLRQSFQFLHKGIRITRAACDNQLLSVLTFLKASTRYRIPFSGTRRPRNNMYESFFSPNLSVIRLASRICGLFTPLGIKCVSLP